MAFTITISQKELKRQAAAAFESKSYKVFLAQNTGSLTSESTSAAWEAVEASGGGYAAVTGTIGTGSYSNANGRYEMPTITATYTATGGGFSYDTLCVKIGSESYLHSILVENPAVVLAAGQSKTYTIVLAQDN